MNKLFDDEPDIIICFNCDAEFTVLPVSVDEDVPVSFCPYCGSDTNEEDEDTSDEDIGSVDSEDN